MSHFRKLLLLLAFPLFHVPAICQQALTWEQVREKFEIANPTLKAAQINIDESRANQITAYLRPNPNFNLLTDGTQLVRYQGFWQPLVGTVISPGVSITLLCSCSPPFAPACKFSDMKWNARLWKNSVAQFRSFISPLVAGLGRSERRQAATHYVEGLLMPGQRKSIEPLAARLGVDSQTLQQLLTSSPWNEERVWRAIRQEVIPHLEPLEAWVVDETGWLKQGRQSVGVSHQYCGAVGKQANCQVSVELVVSDGWVTAPMAGRLYLPESWTQDRKRLAEVGVPEEVEFRTKPELGLELIG